MSTYFKLIDTKSLDKLLLDGAFPFSKYLFWDTDPENIDVKKNKRYIIERVLTRGQLRDVYLLTRLYSTKEIREALLKSRELDAKTVNFCSIYFNIPKKELHVAPFYC